MKLLDYIRGKRRGKEANRLEREALTDPFLSDALDGYMELGEDPLPHIDKLRKQITVRTTRSKERYRLWSAAAVLLVILASGTYFLINQVPDADLYYSLSSQETLFKEVFDEYSLSDAMKEVQELQVLPAGANEPVPLFALPVPVGGEKFVEPYLDFINGEYDIMNVAHSPEVQEGIGKKPEPVVNTRSYKEYLSNHIQIPIDGACGRTKGKVTVSFRVNPSGRPYDIRVIKGLCESLDNEAVRLVREGPDWKFGDQEVKMTIQL